MLLASKEDRDEEESKSQDLYYSIHNVPISAAVGIDGHG
jgi:hypothetical protein